ncbi:MULTISPECIES: DUF421 domain-containing protein [Bacillus]|uniref:DUF421 domain-containing protein n=1 Tax=Bacillus TaxID=1386 RepID=UPI00087778CA|nr:MULTISPECIES: DUF421 domain-containing protein [Bacillus]MBT2259963.1 DUF421 domain-containing protein [Bacillus safensis]MDH6562380.1 uncharacterized membrane protein YcaP (DUF421 family) [Bacillus sp. TBS-096]
MPDHIEVILRMMFAFAILFGGARLLGKQTIAQMNIFDFIAAISLGSIAANLAFNTTLPLQHTTISFVSLVMIIYVISLLALRSRKMRGFMAGKPTLVIQNGKILEGNMKGMRYTLDYLNQQLREKDIFDISEVEFAMIETDGHMSVKKYPSFEKVTRKDLHLFMEAERYMPIEVIMDGKLIQKNIQENQLTEQWIEEELKKRQLSLKDIVYAVRSSNGNLYIDTYDDHIHSPIDQE